MTKDKVIEALERLGVDASLTEAGEVRADLLEIALKGANIKHILAEAEESAAHDLATANDKITKLESAADEAKKANEAATDTLMKRIEELEDQKTPVEKAGKILHKKSGKNYRLKLPKTNFRGKLVTAETLNQDQSLLKELIASKTTLLMEVKKEA